MPTIFTIFRDRRVAAAVERYFRYTRGWTVTAIEQPRDIDVPRAVAADAHLKRRAFWPPKAFARVADHFESKLRDGEGLPALPAVAIVEVEVEGKPPNEHFAPLDRLNPLAMDRGDWSAAVAMLVLAFPEVHWCFYAPRGFKCGTTDIREAAHAFAGCSADRLEQLARLLDAGVSPLFDVTGLRNGIRTEIGTRTDLESRPVVQWVPHRLALSLSLDDEGPYAYFTAYTAYRFGFRAAALSSFEAMRTLLDPKEPLAREPPLLTFEDFYISAPDMEPIVRLEDAERLQLLPLLGETRWRVWVTLGRKDTATAEPDPGPRVANCGGDVKTVFKPLSGIFDLWTKSGVEKVLADAYSNGGVAPCFVSPIADLDEDRPSGGHVIPGRLLSIADRLLRRADAILRDASTVQDAVHGSCLALDAVEYLGHRTPTTSLEALSLKHRLEVTAECMFRGVEQAIDVDRRLAEVDRDVELLAHAFPRAGGFAPHAKVGLVNDVMRTFREHGRFDEELQSLSKARKLNAEVWRTRHRHLWWLPVRIARSYVDRMLGSVPLFLLCIALWVGALSVLFAGLCPQSERRERDSSSVGSSSMSAAVVSPPAVAPNLTQANPTERAELPQKVTQAAVADSEPRGAPTPFAARAAARWWLDWRLLVHRAQHGVRDGLSTFFGVQPPHDETLGIALFLTVCGMVAGFVHLGILVSHLYSLLARR